MLSWWGTVIVHFPVIEFDDLFLPFYFIFYNIRHSEGREEWWPACLWAGRTVMCTAGFENPSPPSLFLLPFSIFIPRVPQTRSIHSGCVKIWFRIFPVRGWLEGRRAGLLHTARRHSVFSNWIVLSEDEGKSNIQGYRGWALIMCRETCSNSDVCWYFSGGHPWWNIDTRCTFIQNINVLV